MQVDTKFLKLMIASPQIVRKAVLTDDQIKLFKYIDYIGVVTSREVADAHGWSVQNATTKLKKLYDAGYLKRRKEIHESGGIEYHYYTAFPVVSGPLV